MPILDSIVWVVLAKRQSNVSDCRRSWSVEKTGHTPIANLSNPADGFELIGVEDAVVTEGGVYFEKDFSYNEEINSIQ